MFEERRDVRVRWLGWAPLAIGCVGKVSAGEACSFQDAETYDTVCRDGECTSPDESSCTFSDD